MNGCLPIRSPETKTAKPKKKWQQEWLLIGNVFLPDWIVDPGFVIDRTAAGVGGAVRFHFRYDESRRNSPEFPDHIKSGFIDFDPARSYCATRYQYRIVRSEERRVGKE